MNMLTKVALIITLLPYGSGALAIPNNLQIRGNLVEEPCTILPGDEKISLIFWDTPEKNFYANGHTASKDFVIKLSDCDTSIGKSVKVTFSGTPSPALPGFLALSNSSTASGFAIGIQNSDGSPLDIAQEGEKIALQNGATQLHFQAFLKGEPDAISNKTIKVGPYNATATFKLDYE
ncbi:MULTISPECIES: fimbrial protein [Providencia]|uniref:Minor fimbrial subunit n=1 Tax=Providencia heimbachae ATCC 35613 TaxID=1354272 RepID=A0A1B7JX21_9GAMM|nr:MULTISPECIES: fimbrial protein [Providencia]MBP6122459.1 type 1 fimbrial protein [Providencia sp.]NIH24118.1 type 1 fimbrial protein [Providencia heimbachae]OAT52264.1 minor fimbrial subunit [Providencia heimbachae ATCC 35613]QCJ71512.1 type 1 fimbrial protein [Providencia heimbachae]SQH15111.1 Fimbrial adapter papK precursor [Providencia heimbachae]